MNLAVWNWTLDREQKIFLSIIHLVNKANILASLKGIILKNQFGEEKIINLGGEFYTSQESHMKSKPEL